MTLPRTLGPAILLLTALTIGAEQAPKGQVDPQAKYEPRSSPGAGQQFLQKFVGDWDVVKTFHPRSGEPVRMTGQCRQAMIHDGRFLQCEFTFDHAGTKTTGLGIVGYEVDSGRFTSVWTDSRSTRMSLRQSQDKFTGEEIVLYGRSLNDGARTPARTRTVTRLEDDGRKLVHRQYLIGAEGKERLMMELLMTKKAKAAEK
ncbi:MAG TPA: DUF1579 family protein [Gemmataceae bacterium]|jgi:hypothetical protein|nr:DUF1579 family protein [Gemmataceae bacterium]